MLIPHLHFCGDCEKAIALYEKAFDRKAENIVHNYDYARWWRKGNVFMIDSTLK